MLKIGTLSKNTDMKRAILAAVFTILSIAAISQTIEQAFVDKLNEVRKERNLPAFVRASEFDSAAKAQSTWMIKTVTLSHQQAVQVPGMKLLAYPWDRGREYGADVLSENLILAVQYKNNGMIDSLSVGNSIFQVWHDSKSHLQNMMVNYGSAVVPTIGIAITEFPGSNSCSVVAVFGVRPCLSELASSEHFPNK